MNLIFALILLSLTTAWSNEYLETPSFQGVETKLQELRTRYAAKDILIVLDIDNTLLRAKQSLGSDQWFEWQNEAITKGTSEAIYASVEELLKVQANFYQLSTMALTDPRLPQVSTSFQKAGHKIFLLTSRSPSLRNVTERELKRNMLWFGASSPMKGIPEEFLELPFKNPVSFMNGIFMTAGHHKGEALDYIVRKSGKSFKAIVFVDDLERHTKRVYDVFSVKPNVEILTFRYSMEDMRVQTFKTGAKEKVINEARAVAEVVNKVFKK